jgi:gliding motility-associated-like protein
VYKRQAIFSTNDTISTDTVPSPFIAGLAAGTYSCEITASNGCKWDFSVTFVQPLPITVGLTNIVPVVCYADSTGSVTLDDVHGGTAPYTYLWSNATTQNPLVNVPAGVYHVTITDVKMCTIEETYIIEQPYEPIKFFPTVTSTSCQQSEDGMVVVYANDIYWTPYNNMLYLYDSLNILIDSAAPGEIMGQLPPGHFTVVLINEMGCRAETSVFVAKGPDDCIQIPNLVTANGDGYNDDFRVKGACEYDSFIVNIFTDLGKKVFESQECVFTWDPREIEKASPNTVFYYYIKVTEGTKAWEFRNSININY